MERRKGRETLNVLSSRATFNQAEERPTGPDDPPPPHICTIGTISLKAAWDEHGRHDNFREKILRTRQIITAPLI